MPVRRICPTITQLKAAEFRSRVFKMNNTDRNMVTCIECRLKPEEDWMPWTVVAPSALLRSLSPPVYADGLYAARRFAEGSYVGVYPRTRSWAFKSRYDEGLIAVARKLVLLENIDTLITVKAHPRGVLLVDGTGGGGPEVQKANDPKGTRRRRNAIITEGGIMQVVTTGVKAFDMSKSIESNIDSELRIDYGDEFWKLFDVKGSVMDEERTESESDQNEDDIDESDQNDDDIDESDQNEDDIDDRNDDGSDDDEMVSKITPETIVRDNQRRIARLLRKRKAIKVLRHV